MLFKEFDRTVVCDTGISTAPFRTDLKKIDALQIREKGGTPV
jgi:hypothetical protein